MEEFVVGNIPHPSTFNKFAQLHFQTVDGLGETLANSRGSIPSIQAAKLRGLMLRAHADNSKIVARPCTYDDLSSKLVEEAAFPAVFLSGFSVASSFGLPDTGYIAFQKMTTRIQETVRQVQVPVIADGDTGFGSPMNVRRTVRG
jgi:methylisocitrate lyase